jgi:hypothetical protein
MQVRFKIKWNKISKKKWKDDGAEEEQEEEEIVDEGGKEIHQFNV